MNKSMQGMFIVYTSRIFRPNNAFIAVGPTCTEGQSVQLRGKVTRVFVLIRYYCHSNLFYLFHGYNTSVRQSNIKEKYDSWQYSFKKTVIQKELSNVRLFLNQPGK